MVGHGGPLKAPGITACGGSRRANSIRRPRIALAVCALTFCLSAAAADELDLQLRITWGEGNKRHWSGTLRLSKGEFSDVRRLGYEANAPTTATNRGDTLLLLQPAPVTFDGIDVRVQSTDDATLTIQLQPDRNPKQETSLQLRLADFVTRSGFQSDTLLDGQGNRLIVRRAPGDQLRIESRADSLVFAPQDVWQFSVQPHRLAVLPDTQLVCSLELISTWDGKQHWSDAIEVQADASGSTQPIGPMLVTLPLAEGTYELTVTIREKGFAKTFLAERKAQCVVIGERVAWPPAAEWQVLQPKDSNWWKRRLAKLNLAEDEPRASSHGTVTARNHLGQSLTELAADSWYASLLPVSQPGMPHVLEVEYPNDVPQTLGISIIEPNAAGEVGPLQLDSGIDVQPLPTTADGKMERHRIVFWPKTSTPWVLFSNRSENRPALFGKFQVSAGPSHLPDADVPAARVDRRMLAAYYDRPLFPENFSAPEALDEVPKRSLDDWNTFYTGGLRLVDYLKHVGYNAAIISVARDGGTIYPSTLIESTPRYDSGVFFLSGQDPQQKDVLEMLFRLFDREQLKLVPAIHLSTRLPELERLRERGGAAAAGIDLVGADGKSWTERYATYRGQAPYYNALDPRVQMAIRNVVKELVDRYSHHPSFAGVSLQLGPYTYVQLPGSQWGNDDRTVARFVADTKAEVPLQGPDRFAKRASIFAEAGRKAWLSWRAKNLGELYRKLQQDVARNQQSAKLYLSAAELVTSLPVYRELQPRSPGKLDLDDAMLQHGLDVKPLGELEGIVVMRPQRLQPITELVDHGANLQLQTSESVDVLFRSHRFPAAVHHHDPVKFFLPSFDAKSPFGPAQTHTWFAANISPNGQHYRAKFTRSLAALDSQMIAEGGWVLPLGQQESTRRQLEAFRMLPAAPFETVTPASPEAASTPLVVRTLRRGVRTYFYVVNDSPWPVSADIHFQLPSRATVHRFGTDQPPKLRPVEGARAWPLQLEPFDLVAGYVDAPQATIVDWRARFSQRIKAELAATVLDVTSRVDKLRKRTPLAVIPNTDFEMPAQGDAIPGWQQARGPGITIDLDTQNPHAGRRSLHMRVDRPGQIAWVRSVKFTAPKTSRISVLAWIRTRNTQQQPALRIAVDDGRSYYKYASLGIEVNGSLRPTGNKVDPVQEDWPQRPFLFHITDLPASGLESLMVGFDLMGPGEVWIDEVTVYDLYFFGNEVNELLKNAANADFHLDKNDVAECDRYLNSYWPRYLIEHVPQARIAQVPILQATQPEPTATEPQPASGWKKYVPSLPKWKLPFFNSE